MSHHSHNILVAVVGGSGAGKSWLVERLCRVIGEDACSLSLDDFYRDRSHVPLAERARANFDVPTAIDWNEAARVLRDCRTGIPGRLPSYDFATYSRSPARRPWTPRAVVFAEGLWLLRSAQLRELFDLSVYLDAPASLRLARRLERDTTERGYRPAVVRQRLATMVFPMHVRYVEPQKRLADVVLGQPYGEPEIRHFGERLWALLSGRGLLPPWNRETFCAELISLLVRHEYCT